MAVREVYDGLVFDAERAVAEATRDGEVYSGVRVSLTAQLAAARWSLHIDVNVGDPIWPPPETVSVPRLLAGEITLTGYPLAMVHAEKLVTAVGRGVANTRWRDFADVYLLSRRHDVDGAELAVAIQKVAAYRGVPMQPLRSSLDGYAQLAQSRWAAWRRKQGLADRLPSEFAVVLQEVVTFADPAVTGATGGHTWLAAECAWSAR